MNIATLQGVRLGFGGRAVLHDVSLALREGEFVGLLGGNGTGKTTLMRALLGLVRPSAGSIDVQGAPARAGHPAIGYLPQSGGALPSVRGRDLLAAGAGGAAWGVARQDAATREAVDAVLAELGATALAERPIDLLSGGERQRVLIAQALLGSPKLLLLDEPLAGLDPVAQQRMVALLRSLQTRRGLTVLCSAHDINMLLPAMDRVLYLGGGQAALGTIGDVITAPVLSRLYGAPMDVIWTAGGLFVLPASQTGAVTS
jgi:zinc/manganese transport system ATP-binding protein